MPGAEYNFLTSLDEVKHNHWEQTWIRIWLTIKYHKLKSNQAEEGNFPFCTGWHFLHLYHWALRCCTQMEPTLWTMAGYLYCGWVEKSHRNSCTRYESWSRYPGTSAPASWLLIWLTYHRGSFWDCRYIASHACFRLPSDCTRESY